MWIIVYIVIWRKVSGDIIIIYADENKIVVSYILGIIYYIYSANTLFSPGDSLNLP
jgi:hypothetical protein